jgi:phosphatidylserine/phosphatidylglycerophosphate/cardiolipin synthase-like enzyme
LGYIISQNICEGGYFFLKEGFIPAIYAHLRPPQEGHFQFCATYQNSGSSILEIIIDLLKQAKKKVFINAFMIGEQELLKTLIETVERLHGGVYIITSLSDESIRKGIREFDDDLKTDLHTIKKQFSELTSRGIYVRGHEHNHAKFLVVDDQVALVTTANFDNNSYKKNGEVGVVVYNQEQVQNLARLFTSLWFEGCVWEIKPGTTYTVTQRIPEKSVVKTKSPHSYENAVIWTSEPNEFFILDEIRSIIQSAARDLIIFTYSWVNMPEHSDLIVNYLADSLSRGVKIRFFVRGRGHIAKFRSDFCKLQDMGVEIYADTRNHAKGIIADKKRGAIFSANYDANNGLTNGVEVGVKFHQAPVLTHVCNYVEHAIQNANLSFVRNPSLIQMYENGLGSYIAKWDEELDLMINATECVWNDFYKQSKSGVVLFQQKIGENTIQLFAGQRSYSLIKENHTFTLTEPKEANRTAHNLLDQWLSETDRKSADSSNSDRIGVCPAEFTLKE